jgi:hypothetical protein
LLVNDLQKPCICCGEEKSLADFYPHPQMADGHLNKCKPCVRRYQQERYRYLFDTDPAFRAKQRQRNRRRMRSQKARQRDRERRQANIALNNAVRDGRVEQPELCSVCGKEPEVRMEAHHEDYSKPFDVEWLCSICHGKRHRIDPQGG